jgi:branched-chain amino acid transport system permease protein
MDLIESYREELKLVRKPWSKVWVAVMIAAAFLMPFYLSAHLIYLATLIVIFSIGVLGQNLLIGYTGQISFGQAGFLAIGAFTFGHLSGWGVPWPLCALAGGGMAALFGILIGIPSLRLKGPYLAIVTMGFGVAVYQILVSVPLLSGGRMGMVVARLDPVFGLTRINFYFYLNLIICLLFIVLTYNIVSSYMGRAFIAIRDNDIAAEVLGVNLTRYKLMAFAISSFYVGVQGGLYALLLGYLEANMFTWMETIGFLVAVIVGGLAMINGSIMGAAFVILVPHFFSAYKELVPVVFGLVIIVILIFEPQGLAGRIFKMRLYFRNWPFR